MNILFAAAEVLPFSKAGGLADVAGALPKALEHFDADTRIITPGYSRIPWEKYSLRDEMEFSVPVDGVDKPTKIVSTLQPDSNNVRVYLVLNEQYFDREGIYTDSSGRGFQDDDERFIFFMQSILEWVRREAWKPDILHCNDHHTGLLPAYVHDLYNDESSFESLKTLFTIHNMGYQGVYPGKVIRKAGFPSGYADKNPEFRHDGGVNFMKVALLRANKINTVSPTYAEEIMSSPEFGYGLEEIVRQRKDDVSGILNGADYSEWSPETDEYIPYNFSQKDISGKAKNRDELLREFRLMAERSTPVIGMISRLVEQKGFDLMDDTLDDLLSRDVHLVILGTGETRYHRLLEEAKEEFPEKIGLEFAYDNPLAHLIEAGSDMFLMPSKYEPCGLNQMYSLKYGTIPIVHATGGLADTIRDFDPDSKQGNGFSFREYTPEALLDAVDRAIDTFRNKARWKFLRDNAMRCDFSWEVSARKYLELYQNILES